MRKHLNNLGWLSMALFGIGLIVFTFIFRHDVVEGDSMEPSIHSGEHILINISAYSRALPRRGDVIVFGYPGDPRREFIKRVVGLPGEMVSVRRGKVFVNGAELNESYSIVNYPEDLPPTRVPRGTIYVMGDNRPRSNDSRIWGPLKFYPFVHGRAEFVVWPPGEAAVIR